MPTPQQINLENINILGRSILPPSATTIHTIEKCFVDLNFQLNEDVNTFLPIRTATFSSSIYNISEGNIGNISITLNSPSVLGVEELDLHFVGTNSQSATIGQDIIFDNNFNQPLRISWSIGEQTKVVPFTALTDSLFENVEKFYFKLDHFTNCKSGSTIATEIDLTSTNSIDIDLGFTGLPGRGLGG